MTGRFVWGTVTGVSPLRVQLDGDTSELPITPDSLVDPLMFSVDDRVRCELSKRRLIIHGRAGGVADTGWVGFASFESSFTGASSPAPAYRRIGSTVMLRGELLRASAPTSLATACVLPDGYRPDKRMNLLGVGSSSSELTYIRINTDGAVQVQAGVARSSTPGYSLAGCAFFLG